MPLAATPPARTLIIHIIFSFGLQLVDLKEAEQQSLKESERLDKEIADVQELKVNGIGYLSLTVM